MSNIISLDGRDLMYRIGESDRLVGSATSDPEGFAVLNRTNGHVFIATGGMWTVGGTFPFPTTNFDFPTLLAQWFGTNSIELSSGTEGYRVGTSDRTVGAPSYAPDNFFVLNTTTGNVFMSLGGVWTLAGSFPMDLYAAWLMA